MLIHDLLTINCKVYLLYFCEVLNTLICSDLSRMTYSSFNRNPKSKKVKMNSKNLKVHCYLAFKTESKLLVKLQNESTLLQIMHPIGILKQIFFFKKNQSKSILVSKLKRKGKANS